MADISMCCSENCESKKSCFRKLAKPSEYQSYVYFGGLGNENIILKCEYYISTKNDKKS